MNLQHHLGLIPLLLVCLVAQGAPAPSKELSAAQQLLLEVSLPALGQTAGKVPGPKLVLTGTNLTKYADKPDDKSKLRATIRKAQVLLWASQPTPPPRELLAEVLRARTTLKLSSFLFEGKIALPQTAAETKAFSGKLLSASRDLARLTLRFEEVIEELQTLEKDRDKETPRWQAHYDLMLAALLVRSVALEDHSLMLGLLRREILEYDTTQNKFLVLIPTETPRDSTGRRLHKETQKVLSRIEKEHAKTVWATLADWLKNTHYGAVWKPVP